MIGKRGTRAKPVSLHARVDDERDQKYSASSTSLSSSPLDLIDPMDSSVSSFSKQKQSPAPFMPKTKTVLEWKILASTTVTKKDLFSLQHQDRRTSQNQGKNYRTSLGIFTPHSLILLFLGLLTTGLTLTNILRSLDHSNFDKSSSTSLTTSYEDDLRPVQVKLTYHYIPCENLFRVDRNKALNEILSVDDEDGDDIVISKQYDRHRHRHGFSKQGICLVVDDILHRIYSYFVMIPSSVVFGRQLQQVSKVPAGTTNVLSTRNIDSTVSETVVVAQAKQNIDENQVILSVISETNTSTKKERDWSEMYPRVAAKVRKAKPDQSQNFEKSILKKKPSSKPLVQPNDFIYREGGDWDSAPIVLEEFKLVFFTSAKVGCSVWKSLFRRMMHYNDWNVIGGDKMIPWNPETNGLKYLYHYSPEEASRMLTAKDWTRALFVRDPKERFVSAYLDKVVNHNTFIYGNCCIPSYKSDSEKNITTSTSSSASGSNTSTNTQSLFHERFANETAEQRYARQMKELLSKTNWKTELGVTGPNGATLEDTFHQQAENETPQQRYLRQKKDLMKYYNPSTILLKGGPTKDAPSSLSQFSSEQGDFGNAKNRKSRKKMVIDDWCTNFKDLYKSRTSPKIFLKRIMPKCENSHWRRQSKRMEDKYWKYINFLGHMDTVAIDAERLLKKIGAWELYGSNGWDSNNDNTNNTNTYAGRIFAPQQSMGRTHATNAASKLQSTIDTITLEHMIEEYYSDDYKNPILNFTLTHIHNHEDGSDHNNNDDKQDEEEINFAKIPVVVDSDLHNETATSSITNEEEVGLMNNNTSSTS